MKIVSYFLLPFLLWPLGAFAKAKSKAGKGSSLIDMSAVQSESPEGLISTELNGQDVQFFLSAYEVGALETWLGGQAKTRGESDKVKAVGDALQSTQAEETGLLVRLAKRKGVALGAPKMPAGRQKQAMTELAALTGAKFDSAVMEQITAATQQATEVYGAAVQSSDPEVKHFATQILPMAREKLTLASRVSGKALPPGAKPGFHETAPIPAPPAPAVVPLATPARRVPASPPPPRPMTPAPKPAATTPLPKSPMPAAAASPAAPPSIKPGATPLASSTATPAKSGTATPAAKPGASTPLPKAGN